MPDVTLLNRDEIMELAYQRLRDPVWRARLTARSADGSSPIVFALPSDSMAEILRQAEAFGGNANVVLAVLNGITVFTMEDPVDKAAAAGCPIPSDVTAGLFFQRLVSDGGSATYCFGDAGGHTESGHAELVALAG